MSNADKYIDKWKELSKEWREAIEKVRAERIKNGKITITREVEGKMVKMIVDANAEGLCENVREGEPLEPVKAGDNMCSVGIIRRGRNWGDYGGDFCCECPYFRFKRKRRK